MEETSKENLYKWDKEKNIENRLNRERNLDWYKNRYKRNLTISFVFALISFFFAISTMAAIGIKSQDSKIYFTSISGKVISYKITKDKKNELEEAKKVLFKRN